MLTTDFYFKIILLTALLLIAASHPRCITCPCGSMVNSQKYTHCIKGLSEKNPCDRWANCETCKANRTYCLTCPKGRSGLACFKEEQIFCKCLYPRPNSRLITPVSKNELLSPGNQLVYVCNPGYKTTDLLIIKCLRSGRWSSLPPKCNKIVPEKKNTVFCKHPYVSPYSVITTPTSKDQKFLPLSQLEYACKDGYTTKDLRVIKCLNSGSWSSRPPTCSRIASKTKRRVSCSYPDLGPNIRLITSFSRNKKFFPGAQMLYVCKEGYKSRNRPVLKCLHSGQWSLPLPTCDKIVPEPIKCPFPDVDLTGMIVETFPNITDERKLFDPGSRIQYDCKEGYEFLGAEWIIYCNVKGEWTSEPPTCKAESFRSRGGFPETFPVVFNIEPRKTCPNPNVGPNAVIEDITPSDSRGRGQEFEPGSQLNITCKDGYERKGNSLIVCLRNGEWSKHPPKCRRIPTPTSPVPSNLARCTDLGAIAYGWITVLESTIIARRRPTQKNYTYPIESKLEYECRKGYRLQGKKRLNCRFTGQWNGKKPSCVPDCGYAPIRPNLSIRNGTKTIPGQWPWTVAIAVNENTTRIHCTGVLLNDKTVLTEAHCVRQNRDYTLFFGIFNIINRTKESSLQERKSCRIVLNPNFKRNTSGIAIVTFDPPIRYTNMVQPVCLPTPDSSTRNLVPGEKGFVSGWDLPIRNFIGSPMVFYSTESRRFRLEGLVSRRSYPACKTRKRYITLTRVADFMPWILDKLRTQEFCN